MKRRLDHLLVELGLAPSRSKAQQMIAAGEVLLSGKSEPQASTLCNPEDIQVQAHGKTLKYVSRGGLKLEGALDHLGLKVEGWRCLDVGLSTGGFADCLLKRGAAAVAGFDVGRGQLHPSLHGRVPAWEELHVRDLPAHGPLQESIAQGLNLVVVDVSFISLEQVLPYLPKSASILALVKPQFEVGADNLNRRGVVVDTTLFAELKSRMLQSFAKYGFTVLDYFASRVKGQDGNQEFFAYAVSGPVDNGLSKSDD